MFLITDFGVETLTSLIKATKFPWLLSNVTDSLSKLPLAGSIEQFITNFNGIKVWLIDFNYQIRIDINLYLRLELLELLKKNG